MREDFISSVLENVRDEQSLQTALEQLSQHGEEMYAHAREAIQSAFDEADSHAVKCQSEGQ
jgi:hypothetical protein